MRVDVSLEYRFHRTPDGAAWTDGPFARPFWDRYLDVFEGVRVVARAHPVAEPPPAARRVDGGSVELWPLPGYVGPVAFARRYRAVRAATRAAVAPGDALLLRAPSPLAALLARDRRGRPYGLEVVGDPADSLRRGAIEHLARPAARRWLTQSLRRLCRDAAAIGYVTAGTLQARYPPGPGSYATHYSSIELPDQALAAQPRPPAPARRLVTVASLAHRHKGVDVLIDALGEAVAAGSDMHLTIVGSGVYQAELASRAAAAGLAERVEFTGQLPAAAVAGRLDQADLFVLASRTEGLPRALVEAMARGLPCLATAAGGIPELLPEEALVRPGSAPELAAKLRRVADDPAWLGAMAARNLGVAADYRESALRPRRISMYRRLRAATEAWMAQ